MKVTRLTGRELSRSFIWLAAVYLAGVTLLAWAAYWFGQVVQLPQGWECGFGVKNAADLHSSCIVANTRGPWPLRLGVIAIFILPILKMVTMLTGCASIRDLLFDMMTPDNNDSPAWLTLGIGASVAIPGIFLPYNDWQNFLVNFSMRVSLIAFIAFVVTILLMRFGFRLKTYNQYVEAINRSGTNALAMWTIAVYIFVSGVIAASRT